MKFRTIHIFLLFFLVFDSCIEPFEVNIPVSQQFVVVDGLVTDQPGPYTIRLFRASPIEDQLNTPDWITNSSMVIRDDQGNAFSLKESSPGNYQTNVSFRAVQGRSYTLQIAISEGERFESLPQTLLPVGAIDRLYYEFVQVEDPGLSMRNPQTKNGFNIFLDGQVLPDQNKRIRWRTTGTYEITTLPQLKKTAQNGPGGVIVMVPDPPACSGYRFFPVRRNPDGTTSPLNLLTKLNDCTCCTCWPTVYEDKPVLSDPKFLNDNKVVHQKLALVPADRAIFSKKYYFQVEQMSMTTEAFEFWQKIKKQEGTGSDLFQTPAARTTGNMMPVGETKTQVIGLFGVSSISSRSFFIDRTDIPYALLPMDTVAESCLKAYKNNTNTKPLFWQ
jgi:hypothetical protein